MITWSSETGQDLSKEEIRENQTAPIDPLLDIEQEAEIPVPERLISNQRSKDLVRKLRLSQKIGLLLALHRNGALTPGGQLHLLYLQKRASFEALRASIVFCERLQEISFSKNFVHESIELNRRPRHRNFRKAEVRRIGVGYRDKGTLPSFDAGARVGAARESWIPFEDLSSSDLKLWVTLFHSDCLSEDGLWLDIQELAYVLQRERRTEDFRLLFHPL